MSLLSSVMSLVPVITGGAKTIVGLVKDPDSISMENVVSLGKVGLGLFNWAKGLAKSKGLSDAEWAEAIASEQAHDDAWLAGNKSTNDDLLSQ
jgi:hypothetical protein